jgi:hypothetical protein
MSTNLILGCGHAEPVFDAEGPNSDLYATTNSNCAVFRRDHIQSTKSRTGTRSQAWNYMRITVYNNIYVFAIAQRLMDKVMPISEHAKAISLASQRARPRPLSCPSRRRGSQPPSNTYLYRHQHELWSVHSPKPLTSPIRKPRPYFWPEGPCPAEIETGPMRKMPAERTGTRCRSGRAGFVQLGIRGDQ